MTGVRYTCPACAAEHRSRVRAVGRRQFEAFNPYLGTVMERCPHTGAWIRCEAEVRYWHDAPGAAKSIPDGDRVRSGE